MGQPVPACLPACSLARQLGGRRAHSLVYCISQPLLFNFTFYPAAFDPAGKTYPEEWLAKLGAEGSLHAETDNHSGASAGADVTGSVAEGADGSSRRLLVDGRLLGGVKVAGPRWIPVKALRKL